MNRSACVLLLLAAACSPEPPPPAPAAEQGREETRNIRATEAVGYAGDAVADKVDAALEQNEQRKAGLDAQIDADSTAAEADSNEPEQP